MKKLLNQEMKGIDGGLYYCCTHYTATENAAWLAHIWCSKKTSTSNGSHWDSQTNMIEVHNKKGQYMSLYGH